MNQQSPTVKPNLLVAAIVLVAVAIGVLIVAGRHLYPPQIDASLRQDVPYTLGNLKKVDPALIFYKQTAEIELAIQEPQAVAVGPEDRVYAAGKAAIVVFDSTGKKSGEFPLESQPQALAVGDEHHKHPGWIYVAMQSRVEVFDAVGKRLAQWEDLGERATLTSVAVGEDEIVVADAGNRIVYRYSPDGKLLGRIGERDPSRDLRGFVIPSPYFDVALTPDGLIRVVNPGAHRVEGFTRDGHLEVKWGQPGTAIEAFCGCCNPANFAVLPDSSFVTAEKGIPRVKIYSPDGQFQCVVADPGIFAPGETILEETREEHRLPVLDVAADRKGRVLVLDPKAAKIRIFERESEGSDES